MNPLPLEISALTASAFLLLFAYHLGLLFVKLRFPEATIYARNARTRAAWVREMMGKEHGLLAVQTLRNWTMAASFLASTAILIALALLNIVLTPPHQNDAGLQMLNFMGTRLESFHQIKLLILSVDFFFTFFNFTMAIRYYNHLGFMINVPQSSTGLPPASVVQTVQYGAAHYTLGMRGYYLSVPLALWLFGPGWLLVGTLIVIAILCHVDRTG
ncbi:DUF599 domain-containing protein [Thiovibrio frasassiensis]|uniref:DUF599 domain-containing protein n=1 Tax=Thiovibrio frasassiensis TaxID=2984131 RepID=A0A9X4RLU7_9BACT|nr:DUF599 domain-containing protein [Thiovibrio frasassiensis]MDG4476079.1 DUF599 domain-containing protein [Thiovibrio frasassiensis]